MSKRLIFVLGMALWLILFFFSCGNDDEDVPPSINIPLAFFSPMAAGDYTVRITITAPDISNQITSEQNLAIVEGANRTYDVTVDNIPIGNKRGVKVEVFKDAKRLFEGSGTVNISSGENQLALRLEKVAELLSSEPRTGAQLLSTGSLTLNFSAPPGVVTVNGTQAVVQGNTASWKVPGLTAGSTALNIAWTVAGGGSHTLSMTIIGSPATIVLDPGSATLTAIGETVELSATVKDAQGQTVPGASVTWQSNTPAVAEVSASGLVTAIGSGSATITGMSGGKSATAVITVSQASATLAITPSTATLNAIGQTAQLTATVRDANNNPIPGATVTWQSSTPAVASVSTSGLVTAIGSGSATITVMSGGKSATAVITVSQASATMAITPSTTTLNAIGQTAQLTATVRDANNNPITGATVTWQSNTPAVAEVSASGLVTAIGIGSATITVMSGGKSATAVITVSQASATLAITPSTTTLNAIGQTTQLTATVRDANNNLITGATVTWRSNNSAVVSVNSSGLVTARGSGSAIITATSGGKSATAVIAVSQASATMAITPSTTTLNAIGQTTQLTVTVRDANNNLIPGATVTWRSNNSAVVSVNSSGLVTARGSGSATITATSGGKSATAVIAVSQVSATMAITPFTATLNAIGQAVQLTATVRDANNNLIPGATVTWRSNNSAVVSVNSSGLVTARGSGSAIITATSGGQSATAVITVSQVSATMAITPSTATLNAIGQTVQLTATVRDANNNPIPGTTVTWRSNNSAVVSVNSSGLVTARGSGSATITATSGGQSATAVIAVGQSAATLAVTPSTTTLNAIGQTVQLTATVRDANNNPIPGTTVTWRSNNSAVVSVNSSGLVTARGSGSATITATSGGQSATAVIAVGQSAATLAVTPSTTTLNAIGQTTQLTATVRDANNNPITGASVSWSSSNPSVASVSAAGLVTAHGNGNTEIQVRSGNLSQAITITVVVREEAVPSTPAGMVLIPAGEFQMGRNDGASDERPVHTVYLDAFYMDVYEVTNAQYKQFVDANPQWGKDRIPSSYHDGYYLAHWNGNSYPPGKANHPVVYVSWYSAMAYSQWAGKRLPTEAEWEKAARGGLVGKKYPWGDSIDSSKANYNQNVGDTTPVGSYPPNGYGLYDMAGNVWEWCLDQYEDDFYARSPRDNPIAGGSITGIINNFTSVTSPPVLRGGSWGYNPGNLRVANRNRSNPTLSVSSLGFRCARAQ